MRSVAIYCLWGVVFSACWHAQPPSLEAQNRSDTTKSNSPAERRSLSELTTSAGDATRDWQTFPLPALDDVAISTRGIRKLPGRHLTLYTDLPSSPEVDELPRVFDDAVPQWCAYFRLPLAKAITWKCVGYLILDKDRFAQVGLIPADLPPFLHGFQRGAELWAYEQPSAYYRRHLLLHEGTHAFMQASLGGTGPPWYMEGVAELLATHRWQDGQLTLRYFPHDKRDFPDWGRIKIIKDGYRSGDTKQLREIMNYDSHAHLQVGPYGWCWAACAFFDGHPVYRGRFRELRHHVRDAAPSFSDRFCGWLSEDWPRLVREWQLFMAQLDYGHDVTREAIEPKAAAPLPANGAEVAVAADRGWQSTGVLLEAGKRYRFEAQGRFQLGIQPKTWWCEPNGVTIRYRDGRPLGMLLGAIVDESGESDGSNGLLSSAGIGLGLETTLKRGGTLYLRVNDYPAELADNQGEVKVRITQLAQ